MSKNKFEKLEGQVIYDLSSKRRKSDNFIALVNNIIPPSDTNLNPNVKNKAPNFTSAISPYFDGSITRLY